MARSCGDLGPRTGALVAAWVAGGRPIRPCGARAGAAGGRAAAGGGSGARPTSGCGELPNSITSTSISSSLTPSSRSSTRWDAPLDTGESLFDAAFAAAVLRTAIRLGAMLQHDGAAAAFDAHLSLAISGESALEVRDARAETSVLLLEAGEPRFDRPVGLAAHDDAAARAE